jgi:endonuclease YncB( thermonuclease family)
VANCVAVDGDTLRCVDVHTHRTVRIRLNGIDAPEKGYCRRSYTRKCTSSSGEFSSRSLRRQVRGKSINYDGLDIDRYRRLIAQVKVNGEDISCKQVRDGYATYVPKWDEGKRLYNSCPYIRRNYRYNGRKAKP